MNAKNGDLGAIVIPDMPIHLHSSLMNMLKLSFPDYVKETNSRSQGETFSYSTLHFSWYNKYCLQASAHLHKLCLVFIWKPLGTQCRTR